MEPNLNPQPIVEPSKISSGLNMSVKILIGVVAVGIVGGLIFYYLNKQDSIVLDKNEQKIVESNVENTNKIMDNQINTEATSASTLSGDEALISASIQELRGAVMNKDSKAFISYFSGPFVAMGQGSAPSFLSAKKKLETEMQNPDAKMWNVYKMMLSELTTTVTDSQIGNCKFTEKSDKFPPAVERVAECSFDYTVDPAMAELITKTKSANAIPVTYKFDLAKFNGAWYLNTENLNMISFVSNMKLPTN